jgi:hypothetical protein
MNLSRSFKWILGGVFVAVIASTLTMLHLDTARLRRQLEGRRAVLDHVAPLQNENTQLQALVDASQRDATAAAEFGRQQLSQLRTEIAKLEQQAVTAAAERTAQSARDAEALDRNRDPRQGLVRLANFEDHGRATPSAAMQTAIWAAMKGDADQLAPLCYLRAETRKQAEALIARLPETTRAQWTPEKLGALWMTGAMTEIPALQIVSEAQTDVDDAVIAIRGPRVDQKETVKLRLTRDGWALILPGDTISMLEKKMGMQAPPKGK